MLDGTKRCIAIGMLLIELLLCFATDAVLIVHQTIFSSIHGLTPSETGGKRAGGSCFDLGPVGQAVGGRSTL